MSKTIKSNEFAVALSDILQDYSFEISEKVSDAVVQAGEFAVQEVRKRSPKRTGKYAKSWKKKEIKTGIGKRNTQVIIHNKDRYRLTHLLESGYQRSASMGGGRVEGIPHIEPARDAAEKFLESRVLQTIKEAGS